MAQLSRFTSVLLVSSLLAACGGKSFEVGDPDPDEGGTNAGGSGQGATGNVSGAGRGGSSGDGGTSAGGTESGGTGQGGSGGVACDGFNDSQPSYIPVAIFNKTSAPLYLGPETMTCGSPPLFSVENVEGSALVPVGNCRTPCQYGGDLGGCLAICAESTAVTLQPGEVLYTSYSGLFDVQTKLPAECTTNGRSPIECSQALGIQPGTFTFRAQAGSALSCAVPGSAADCAPCKYDASGACVTPGSLISGEMHHATTKVYLDESYGVYGGPQRAPAPRPDDSGNGAVALLQVELFFED